MCSNVLCVNRGTGRKLKRVFFSLSQATNNVLIRHGGLQHEAGVNVYVGAFDVIELALAGVPGTVGHLLVEVEGQIQAAQISLKIPFRLRPCHLGFKETSLMTGPWEKVGVRGIDFFFISLSYGKPCCAFCRTGLAISSL